VKKVIKRYTKGDTTVVWQPDMCTHAKKCFHELPEVFNPENRPWVTLENADIDKVIAQVKACPSGALSIEDDVSETTKTTSITKVKVTKGGPLLVNGSLLIELDGGEQVSKSGMTALCRCGASANKPYCDGSHKNIDFDS